MTAEQATSPHVTSPLSQPAPASEKQLLEDISPDLVPKSLGNRSAPHKEQSYRFKKEIKKPLLVFLPCFN